MSTSKNTVTYLVQAYGNQLYHFCLKITNNKK